MLYTRKSQPNVGRELSSLPIFSGLPPYHPLVIQQGFDPAVVDRALRADAAHILAAGYNLKGEDHDYKPSCCPADRLTKSKSCSWDQSKA